MKQQDFSHECKDYQKRSYNRVERTIVLNSTLKMAVYVKSIIRFYPNRPSSIQCISSRK